MDIQEHIDRWGHEWLLIEHLYSKFASEYGMTFATCKALNRIYHEGSSSQKYLCDALSMPKQTVSNFMNALMKESLVERTVSSMDHRKCEYHLTSEGIKRCSVIFKRLDQIEFDAFSQLTQEELAAFTKTNQKITVLIQQELEKGGDEHGSKCKRYDQGVTDQTDR